MSILARFRDIMAANIHALLDKAEDPEKMIDQYLRNLNSDLGKVKAETASVMAEERRAKRAYDENRDEIAKMEQYAIRALEAGNEADARKFLERKAELQARDAELHGAWQAAADNAQRMKQMHDKLVKDIGELEARRAQLKEGHRGTGGPPGAAESEMGGGEDAAEGEPADGRRGGKRAEPGGLRPDGRKGEPGSR